MVSVIGAVCRNCNALVAFDDEDIQKGTTYVSVGYGESSYIGDEFFIICPNCKRPSRLKIENVRPEQRDEPVDTSPLPDPISVPSKEELQVPK